MRIRTYTAPSMRDAMLKVRRDLGEDAVIVSTRDPADGSEAMVTAALEEDAGLESAGEEAAFAQDGDPFEALDDVLDFHRVPPPVSDPIRIAAGVIETGDALALLAGALDMRLKFAPVDLATTTGAVMLIGPPGSGKTVACAKIAAQRVLAGRTAHLVTTDVDRPGSVDRLRALAGRLDVPFEASGTTDELRAIVGASGDTLVVIDTPGTNPFAAEEIQALTRWTGVGDVRRILVLAAGSDPYDDAEIARAFAASGATGIFATRLDSASRFGGLIAGAYAARLPFVAASILPAIGEGLVHLNPVSLARLLLARPLDEPAPFSDAMSQS